MSDKKATNEDKKVKDEDWKNADIYGSGVSTNRIVTRSQTAFLRIDNSTSNLDLIANASKHQPPGQPHLMEALKGKNGAIPRTIITRSIGKYIEVDKDLVQKLDVYKKYEPPQEKKADVKEEKAAVKEDKADVKEEKPGVKEEKPSVKEEKPGVKEEKPGVKEEKPGVKEEKPGVKEEKAGVKEEKADVKEEKAGVKEEKAGVKAEKADVKEGQTIKKGSIRFS
ncbi:hypothetical protein JTE90_003832 [Oedothorax gibbosus]|uniref:Uncharacterized protein n=1 Tax=Oedothorax gibbosus TaxID=931172 RepID=A0AAV6VFW6_9ARAC|nr:hypothetical protein JTE90_003832 [Oedothorax gibbosus]